MNLENLDRALHDLGMLSAVTEARREYLQETKSDYCMMRLNTRYVSNVTVGYCMKKTPAKNRLCPYVIPPRHRTKSENSEAVCCENVERRDSGNMEPSTSSLNTENTVVQTKRCQSLENLNLLDASSKLETSKELDCVSHQIEKLQVDE